MAATFGGKKFAKGDEIAAQRGIKEPALQQQATFP